MQLNAALIAGYDATKIFSSAHVVHPLRRAVMADLFDKYLIDFVENIKHRFRDLSQFLPQGLHNHACIAADNAIIHKAHDHFHITSGYGVGRPRAETWSLLQNATNPEIKFLCVNDLPQLEAEFPEARDWLQQAIGGAPRLAS